MAKPDRIIGSLLEADFTCPRLPPLLNTVREWLSDNDVDVASIIIFEGPEDYYEPMLNVTWRAHVVYRMKMITERETDRELEEFTWHAGGSMT